MHGALFFSALVAALFFLRFWKMTRERLFLFLSGAFALLGANWMSLAIVHWEPETRHHGFVLRLIAFVLILIGIIDKNRRAHA